MKFKYYADLNESSLNESKFDEVLSDFFGKLATKLGKDTLEDLVDELKEIRKEYGDKPSPELLSKIRETLKETIFDHKREIESNEVSESYINEDLGGVVKKLKDYALGAGVMGVIGAGAGGSLGWQIGYGSIGYSMKVVAEGVASAIATGIAYIGIGAVIGIILGVIAGASMVYFAKRTKR